MERVDTPQSEKVISELKNLSDKLREEGKIYFGTSYSKSTRSIYITTFSWDKEEDVNIRISDHSPSLMSDGNDYSFDFESFDIKKVEAIVNKL